ncbi:L-fuculose kinase [Microbulbifer sp. SH-1]|uniref:FGGY-family carbohydrate kinase n=1 Tax=Microbulbifer sp. SH-1 TaxID=2681547 RepID=UPI0014091A95|nr:FGGY family carbohydrate kinase [Microbulbifer sp. SH-1]QIL91276.1 L-fuculose kinase [Microbulbifer sp. SH-1]
MNHIAVLDIGKTNIKLHLRSEVGVPVTQVTKPNAVSNLPPYPHFDVDSTWEWIIENLRSWQVNRNISKIIITTHGATAALINRRSPQNPLVLPILDYEYIGIECTEDSYQKIRPSFAETGSPNLPAGLNLAKQLFWQQSTFPDEFAKVTEILMYPQYWAWRLTGCVFSEVTSLGCHTDLWDPENGNFSSLVEKMGWTHLFPPLRKASDIAGSISPDVVASTGISDTCKVYVGIHDSNASYYRYLAHKQHEEFTVISTGTWSIAMSNNSSPEKLPETRDLLLNVDAHGSPIVCSRFMAGREAQLICRFLKGDIEEKFTKSDIQNVIDHACYCLPTWAEGTGPYPDAQGCIAGELPEGTPPAALATLYLALMLDTQLELISSKGPIFLEGAYQKNMLLLQIFTALRGNQEVFISHDETGTVTGSVMLTNKVHATPVMTSTKIPAIKLNNLNKYKERWTELCVQPSICLSK